jgi:hypothetical protein
MCYMGRTSYRFVLRLRKFGFLAFNISKPKELLLKLKNLNQEIIPPPKTSCPL